MRLCVFLLFFLPHSFANPEPNWQAKWQSVDELINILENIPEGKATLAKARNRDPNFAKKVRKGNSSFTESTFQRSYSLLDGSEQVEHKFRITLNESLSLSSAVLDFAHELVHFSEKEIQDPYHAEFQAKSFVKNGIEGRGGELAALEKECLISWQLEGMYRSFPVHLLCAPYKGKENAFLFEKARKDYYAVGHYYYSIPDQMKQMFPQVSFDAVRFSSSYAKKPYPVALYEEFFQSKEAACANNRKKFELISAQTQSRAKAGRAPASANLIDLKKRLVEFQKRNCRDGKH
jgi:hypothetical protein